MRQTGPERALETTLKQRKVWEGFEREFKFHPTRKWSADFAHPATRLLVECEGGVYSNGRHVRGKGYEADLEKYNAAVMEGRRILRFSTKQIESGEAADTIAAYLRSTEGGKG